MKKFIYLLLAAVLLLPACTKQEEPNLQDTAPVVDDNKENKETATGEEAFVGGINYEDAKWEDIKTDVEKQSGEILASFYAPDSSANKNTIYVSTQGKYIGEFPNGKQENKIYSYDLDSKVLNEIYKETEDRTLRGLGREDNKLILMLDRIDNSPGPCFSIWANWEKFATLDLDNPEEGLKDFTVPDYLVERGKKEQAECQQSNELGEISETELNCADSGGTFAGGKCTCPEGTFAVDGKDVPLFKLDEKGICTDPMGVPGGKLGEEMKKNHPLNKE